MSNNNIPPGAKEVEQLSHCQGICFGEIDESMLADCRQLVVSPGISLQTPLVRKAKALNIDVCGDVELFVRVCNKPIVAITGSNGKNKPEVKGERRMGVALALGESTDDARSTALAAARAIEARID